MNDRIFNSPSWQIDDQPDILRQRSGRLRLLGYGGRRAACLAGTSVDIDQLERLILKGCPRDTAIRIAL